MTTNRDRAAQPGLRPTPDQDKAITFYESLGFEKRTDTPSGGTHGSDCAIRPGTR
jgi:hypothetical protein